jgi:hypothetical protein
VKRKEPSNLNGMLELMGTAAQDGEHVSVKDIVEALGSRSFGPMLLLAGLITLAPVIGDIPGMPTLMAAIVMLTTLQLLWGREHIWLPRWVLQRSVKSKKVHKAVDWLERPAGVVDGLLRPRLAMFVQGAGVYLIAVVSAAIALMTPGMELIPFSANLAGLAWTAFGLALIARDGLLAILAMASALGGAGLVVSQLLL